MSNGPEDFDKLRKLLRVKQHEQPPPGYFTNFSGLVISRIEREGTAEAAWMDIPWLRRLLRTFETSPLIGGLFGSALCGVVILGIMMANSVGKVPAEIARSPGLANNNGSTASSTESVSSVFGSAADNQVRSTDAMFTSPSNTASPSFTAIMDHSTDAPR